MPLGKLRVLHCLYDVGGQAGGLARAEREIGLDSAAVVLRSSSYGYAVDEVLCGPEDGTVAQELRRWRLLGRAMTRFDVVHFNFGRTIFPPWAGPRSVGRSRTGGQRLAQAYARALWLHDLPLLRAARRSVFVTFQGDDARQGDYTAANFEVSGTPFVEPGYYTPAGDAAKRTLIRRFDRHADGIFALNPDLLHVLPSRARFLPYASVDPDEWPPTGLTGNARPLVIHAPTHRGIKGTPLLLDAVDRLQADGVDFEFRLVENLTRAEARELYERADLLVDQLLVGWYGGLAVELMALGKPVVAYLRQGDLGALPDGMRQALPIIRASPTDVYEVLRSWLTDRRHELAARGAASRAYVTEWHDPRVIARTTAAAYRQARPPRERR